jgi:DNA-binding LacI/PurR family transcriptional regulator
MVRSRTVSANDSKSRPVTLADVTRAAGVSLTTASQALSGKERVSPRTRQEVNRVADRLGYQGNPLARALRGAFDERAVALFATDLDLGVRTRRLHDLQWRLRQEGYRASLAVFGEQENQAAVVRAVCDQRPRAIIADAPGFSLTAETLGALEAYQKAGGILLAYPNEFPADCDQVVLEIEEHTRQAIRHLIGRGHRRVGVRAHGRPSPLLTRVHQEEMEGAGLFPDPAWLYHEGIYEEGGLLLAERYLVTPADERPTAFFVINDVSAAAFVATLARHGVRVPHDLSVIGYDDSPAARCGLVPLTTINTRSDALVNELMRLFLSRVRGEYVGPGRRVGVPGIFVERESVAAPPEP